MKKSYVSILVAAMLMGCGNNTNASKSDTDSVATESAEELVETAYETGEPTDGLPCSLDQLNKIWDSNVDESAEGISRILLYDVDEDGTPEIFLYGDGQYVILTCKDGKLTQVDSVEPGHMYVYIYDDNKIGVVHEFPHGQSDLTSYYTFKDSKATLAGTVSNMYPDALSDNEDEEPADPVVEYKMLKGKKMVEVSKEKFEEIFNPAIAHTTIDDLEWKSIDDFE